MKAIVALAVMAARMEAKDVEDGRSVGTGGTGVQAARMVEVTVTGMCRREGRGESCLPLAVPEQLHLTMLFYCSSHLLSRHRQCRWGGDKERC
jgi:hypothetical protein